MPYDENGDWIDYPQPDDPRLTTMPVPDPNQNPYTNPDNYAPAPSNPQPPQQLPAPSTYDFGGDGSQPSATGATGANYEQQIRDTYASALGRQPTADELRSDLNNATRYGTSGSLLSDIAARANDSTPDRQATSTPTTAPRTTSSTPLPGAPAPSQGYTDLWKQMYDQQQATSADEKAKGDALYNRWNDQANTSLNFDVNSDPILRRQADAAEAAYTRQARNAVSNRAEEAGPYANLEGTRRMEAEHAGQASMDLESHLMAQELVARRAQIQHALDAQGDLLSDEQKNNLAAKLSLLDNELRRYQLDITNTGQNMMEDRLRMP